ncbi:PAS domain S-box protein [Candidatus Hodarchaeum mangrovi]
MELESLMTREDIPKDIKDAIRRGLMHRKESEELYRSLVHASRNILFTTDLKGIITFVNPAIEKLTGWPVNSWIGSKFDERIHPEDINKALNGFQEIIQGNQTETLEIRIQSKDESYRLYEVKGSPLILGGQIKGLLGFVRSVQEQREAETRLKESEEKYRILVERAKIGITIVQDGRIKLVNQALAQLAGLTIEEVLDQPFTNFIHPKALLEVVKRYESRMKGENIPTTYETTLITSNGKAVEVEISAGLINYLNEPADLVIVYDITKMKEVLKELKESEARYRTLITTALEGVWVTDLENKTLYVNPALEKLLGWTLEEMRERHVEEFLSPLSKEFFDKKVKERYVNGIPSSTYELTFLRKDGTQVITRVAGTALYNPENELIGSFGLLSDITSEKTAQEDYRKLIEFNPEGITLTDLNFNIITLNQAALELHGVESADVLLGTNALDLIVPEERLRAIENAQKTLDSSTKLIFEYNLLRHDGSTFPAELIVSTITDELEKPTSFIAITRDITQRKRSEELLLESEKKYRTLVDNINSGIFRISTDGKILQCNPAFVEMFGYDSIEEIQAIQDLSQLYAVTTDREKFVTELYRNSKISIQEVLMRRKNGTIFWASISARVSSSGKWHDGIIENITERKKADILLKQVKLEEEHYHAMLSHFVRNDLQKIVNNLDYLLLQYESSDKLNQKEVKNIINIATKSSRTIDIVNRIFEVLQTPFLPEIVEDKMKIHEVINLVTLNFQSYQRPFVLNRDNLQFEIILDNFIEEVFHEIFLFIIDPGDLKGTENIPINIDGACFSDEFCVLIKDEVSNPIPKEVCERLSAKISDKWEYHGHYIGITLASVIMQHYHGQLKIFPYLNRGNEFQLWFPQNLLKGPC